MLVAFSLHRYLMPFHAYLHVSSFFPAYHVSSCSQLLDPPLDAIATDVLKSGSTTHDEEDLEFYMRRSSNRTNCVNLA